MSRTRNNLTKREKSIKLIKSRRGRGVIYIQITKKNKIKVEWGRNSRTN